MRKQRTFAYQSEMTNWIGHVGSAFMIKSVRVVRFVKKSRYMGDDFWWRVEVDFV